MNNLPQTRDAPLIPISLTDCESMTSFPFLLTKVIESLAIYFEICSAITATSNLRELFIAYSTVNGK